MPTLVITEEADNERITASQSLSGSDLLFKPFKTGELLYRCEKLLEISHGLKLLPNVVSGIRIPNLTIKERRLLTVFLKIETAVISRNDLFRAVWNSVSVHRKTLDVHLFNLRRKLRLYGFDIVHIQDAYRIQSVDLLENPQVNTLS
ncbi:MAG: winged helix family transcriptional regulator [Proteobacteria bacterium]|nr:MAG: winged helix family transcriptional regulator [Pseudomonadota bacterium]